MSFKTVARDQDEWAGNYCVHNLLRIAVNYYPKRRRRRVQLVEARLSQPLAGFGKLKGVVIDAKFVLPSGIEECGGEIRHPSSVGISFGGDVEPARSRARN